MLFFKKIDFGHRHAVTRSRGHALRVTRRNEVSQRTAGLMAGATPRPVSPAPQNLEARYLEVLK